MSGLLAFLLCLALASGQIVPLCGNSPYNYTQLQGILGVALKSLFKNDLLLPNLDSPLSKPCNQLTNPDNCGYPFLYSNGETSQIVGFNNPGSVYGVALTNRSLLPGIVANGAPTRPVTPSDFTFAVEGHEAIIWLGCTPPGGKYFSYTKDLYSEGDSTVAANLRRGVLGDSLNHITINVAAVNTASKFGAATLIIYAADVDVTKTIQNAFVKAGFPAAYHNVAAWPTAMIKLGTNLKTDANLLLIARIFGLNPQLFTAYQQLVGENQPFVRLTSLDPLTPYLPVKPIDPIFSWIPDYTNLTFALSTSEQGYSPHVDQVIQAQVAGIVANLKAVSPGNWVGVPIRPFKAEDDGSKWIFQQSNQGLLFDRDAVYLVFSPQVSIDYSLGGFTVVFGVRSESTNWNTHLPSAAVPNIAQTPAPGNHAVYWDFAFNAISGGLQAQGGFDDSINTSAFTASVAPLDPLGVIWAQGFGANSTAGCGLLTHYGNPNIQCTTPYATYAGGPLLIFQRVYVNPATGVYPSPITILPATVVHFIKQ